jgi:hypothetical protein
MTDNSIRNAVIAHIELLSLPSQQLAYEDSLRNHVGSAHEELICVFCDDLFKPKNPDFVNAFSETELKALSHVYGLTLEANECGASTVAELLKDANWRRVVARAKELSALFQRA